MTSLRTLRGFLLIVLFLKSDYKELGRSFSTYLIFCWSPHIPWNFHYFPILVVLLSSPFLLYLKPLGFYNYVSFFLQPWSSPAYLSICVYIYQLDAMILLLYGIFDTFFPLGLTYLAENNIFEFHIVSNNFHISRPSKIPQHAPHFQLKCWWTSRQILLPCFVRRVARNMHVQQAVECFMHMPRSAIPQPCGNSHFTLLRILHISVHMAFELGLVETKIF